jgi:hypothetical protein
MCLPLDESDECLSACRSVCFRRRCKSNFGLEMLFELIDRARREREGDLIMPALTRGSSKKRVHASNSENASSSSTSNNNKRANKTRKVTEGIANALASGAGLSRASLTLQLPVHTPTSLSDDSGGQGMQLVTTPIRPVAEHARVSQAASLFNSPSSSSASSCFSSSLSYLSLPRPLPQTKTGRRSGSVVVTTPAGSDRHGRNDGMTFTDNPSPRASPLAKVALVAKAAMVLKKRSKQKKKLVRVACKVLSVAAVNDVSQTVFLDFIVIIQWNDEELIGKDPYKTDFASVWNPIVNIKNAHELSVLDETHGIRLTNPATGLVKLTQRYRGTIGVKLHLYDFPFDTQNLRYCVMLCIWWCDLYHQVVQCEFF